MTTRRTKPQGSYGLTQSESTLIPATGFITFQIPGNNANPRTATTGGTRSRLVAIPAPEKLTVQWVENKIREHTDPAYSINRLFYDGDHWQDSKAWTGPMPPSTDPEHNTVRDIVLKSFVSKNCIAEVTNRKAEGAVGREPSWYFTDADPRAAGEPADDAKNPLIDELHAFVTKWWDDNDVPGTIKELVIDALLGGRACMRLYIPPGLLASNGTFEDVPSGDMEAALERLFVHSVKPHEGAVLVNRDNMQPYGLYIYKDEDNTTHAETVFTDGLGKDALTVIKTITGQKQQSYASLSEPTSYSPGNDPAQVQPAFDGPATGATTRLDSPTGRPGDETINDATPPEGVPLGGRLTIFELEVPRLITAQVRSQQKAINKALTMGDRNSELGGFLERTIFNGQMPGHYEDDPNRPGKKLFVRDPYETGASAVNFIRGLPRTNEKGEMVGYETPSMMYRDPVSPTTFQETYLLFYTALLQEVAQVHYLMASEQYASAESRKQARDDFEKSLLDLARNLNAMLRWLLEAVVAYAAWIARVETRYEGIRAVANTRINPGPATADTITSAIALREAGGLSREGMMEESGIDDVDGEIARIEREEEQGIIPPGQAMQQQQMELDAQAQQANQALAAQKLQQNGAGVGSGVSTGRKVDPTSERSQKKNKTKVNTNGRQRPRNAAGATTS